MIGSIGKYIYTLGEDDTVFVHLYIASRVQLTLSDGSAVEVVQEGNGPWEGGAKIWVRGPGGLRVKLSLRKPVGAKGFEVRPLNYTK